MRLCQRAAVVVSLVQSAKLNGLDPYAVSGQVSMALFHELMATASIVGQP